MVLWRRLLINLAAVPFGLKHYTSKARQSDSVPGPSTCGPLADATTVRPVRLHPLRASRHHHRSSMGTPRFDRSGAEPPRYCRASSMIAEAPEERNRFSRSMSLRRRV
jgi:hypothetical protein